MYTRMSTWALSGLLAAGLTCSGAALAQSSAGTMGTNASVRNESTMGGQSTQTNVARGGMNQGSLDQSSMQAGTSPNQNGQMQGQGQMQGDQDQMQGQGHMGRHHGGMMNADQRMAHMTKKYNLTADQQSQIKPILENEQQQMMQMHSDTSMSKQDKMSKMQSMHQDDDQKIEAVMNDQQKKKFEADQQKMMQKHMNKMQNNGNMNGNSSPQGNMNGSNPQ